MTDKRKLSSQTQKLPELRSTSDHVTGMRITILHAYHHPPHPSRVQLRSEHTLLRQTPEFQRHFIELLKLLTSTAKYCRGISRLCCGHWKLSVVGNLRGERAREEEEEKKKTPSKEIKVVQALERKAVQLKKNAFFFLHLCCNYLWLRRHLRRF